MAKVKEFPHVPPSFMTMSSEAQRDWLERQASKLNGGGNGMPRPARPASARTSRSTRRRVKR